MTRTLYLSWKVVNYCRLPEFGTTISDRAMIGLKYEIAEYQFFSAWCGRHQSESKPKPQRKGQHDPPSLNLCRCKTLNKPQALSPPHSEAVPHQGSGASDAGGLPQGGGGEAGGGGAVLRTTDPNLHRPRWGTHPPTMKTLKILKTPRTPKTLKTLETLSGWAPPDLSSSTWQ